MKATVFEMEGLRCHVRCQVFTAAEPAGVGAGKERLETQLGIPLPAATQWELMEPAADSLEPMLGELIRQAAQGSMVHNDDTGMRY